MTKINLVIPAKEEIKDLISLIKVLVKKKFINKLIIVLDENNKTNFFKHKKVKIISKNKGYGSAIKEGFKKSKTKYTCIYNADGSFNIDDLPKMLRLTRKKIDGLYELHSWAAVSVEECWIRNRFNQKSSSSTGG